MQISNCFGDLTLLAINIVMNKIWPNVIIIVFILIKIIYRTIGIVTIKTRDCTVKYTIIDSTTTTWKYLEYYKN